MKIFTKTQHELLPSMKIFIAVIVALLKLHLNNKWRHFYDDNFIIIFYHCWASSEASSSSSWCFCCCWMLFMFCFMAFICIRRTHKSCIETRKDFYDGKIFVVCDKRDFFFFWIFYNSFESEKRKFWVNFD